jgi:hypothetical protein
MFQTIELLEPYLVGSSLLLWEVFVGWCLWESIRSDIQLQRGRPVSDGDNESMNRALVRNESPARSRTPYIPAASA